MADIPWLDLAGAFIAAVALIGFALLLRGVGRKIFIWRAGRANCALCGGRLGRAAARAAVEYYERQYDAAHPDRPPGIIISVFDGPRKYRDAHVVRCPGCGREYVFGGMGAFVEPFELDPLFASVRGIESPSEGWR